MTIRQSYQTDTALMTGGVWFDFPHAPNANGTVPGFKLRRMTAANPLYAKALQGQREIVGDREMTNEEDEKRATELFCDVVLVDWRNFYPDDKDEMAFNKENALAIFTNSEWRDLLIDLRLKAARQNGFAKKTLEQTTGN